MEIVIGTDKNDMGRKAADAAAAKICAAIAAHGGARVVFASAASQFEFLEALLAHREIDWSKVHGFHLDEYVGLPADHPASFRRFLRERLLAKLPCAPAGFTFVGGDAPDPEGVLRDYYEMSAAHESKTYRSATISLVDCGKLEPLATLCKELFETYRSGLAAIDYSTVQGFYRMNKHWFFDLEDILIHAGMTDADHARLTEALNGCVTYKAATERVLDDFDVNIFCGLSMYLPCAGSAKLDSYYRNLAWNSAAGLVK